MGLEQWGFAMVAVAHFARATVLVVHNVELQVGCFRRLGAARSLRYQSDSHFNE